MMLTGRRVGIGVLPLDRGALVPGVRTEVSVPVGVPGRPPPPPATNALGGLGPCEVDRMNGGPAPALVGPGPPCVLSEPAALNPPPKLDGGNEGALPRRYCAYIGVPSAVEDMDGRLVPPSA